MERVNVYPTHRALPQFSQQIWQTSTVIITTSWVRCGDQGSGEVKPPHKLMGMKYPNPGGETHLLTQASLKSVPLTTNKITQLSTGWVIANISSTPPNCVFQAERDNYWLNPAALINQFLGWKIKQQVPTCLFLAVSVEERREKRKGRKLASRPQRTDRKPSFLPPSVASYPWTPTHIALQQVYNPELPAPHFWGHAGFPIPRTIFIPPK